MKKTMNINDNLDKYINAWAKKNNSTYTSFVNIALTQYIQSQDLKNTFEKMFVQTLKETIKLNEKNTIKKT